VLSTIIRPLIGTFLRCSRGQLYNGRSDLGKIDSHALPCLRMKRNRRHILPYLQHEMIDLPARSRLRSDDPTLPHGIEPVDSFVADWDVLRSTRARRRVRRILDAA